MNPFTGTVGDETMIYEAWFKGPVSSKRGAFTGAVDPSSRVGPSESLDEHTFRPTCTQSEDMRFQLFVLVYFWG